MGMGKKKSAAPAATAPAQPQVPTVDTKEYADSQAAKNAEAQARAESNQSATLLQVKDDEELKRQGMGVA